MAELAQKMKQYSELSRLFQILNTACTLQISFRPVHNLKRYDPAIFLSELHFLTVLLANCDAIKLVNNPEYPEFLTAKLILSSPSTEILRKVVHCNSDIIHYNFNLSTVSV
jgi:hypothetical protein